MATDLSTVSYERIPYRNMLHDRTEYHLRETDNAISAGLASRLERYARRRMEVRGFSVAGCRVEVYTMDADQPPEYRAYTVAYKNARGGLISVCGIMVGRGGHPCLDHGFAIGEEDA